jgi:hypothetical protein
MTTDSVAQLVKYQRNIGVVPEGASFSVRTNWAGPLSGLGGSVQKYLAGYKGVVTYIRLAGLPGASPITALAGVVPVVQDLVNGSNADDASQSPAWNAIMNDVLGTFNQANGTNYGISMQSFNISSPSNFSGVIEFLTEVAETQSATLSGQFQLDIQTGGVNLNPLPGGGGHIPPPDPRPVFDWSLTGALDNNIHALTLTLDVKYDHMESDNTVEIIAAAIAGFMSGALLTGIFGPVLGEAGGVATTILVGQTLTQDYNANANSALLNALGAPLSPLPGVVGPIQFTITHPQNTEFTVSVAYPFDSSTWNQITNWFNKNSGSAVSMAKVLRLAS